MDLKVIQPTQTIIFNSLDLEFSAALLDGISLQVPTIDAAAQTATLTLPSSLQKGRHSLQLTFRGKITRQPTGLYLEKYRSPSGEKVLLGTQMEPTDARRMFPCWDEPVFRAKFQLTVNVPAGETAISNTRITAERTLADGTRELSFASTPSMASYLVVLCVGAFESIHDEVDGIKLGVWTTEGKREQGRYALESMKKIVHYYNNYFGVKFPLSKLDLIAVPGGFAGAMENWGGITFNETALLFDPSTSSQNTKETIFNVVAHEIAHQWFGDLVTMAWWDNLWLNEGFASWMGTKCTDHFNPEWQIWLRANAGKEYAMSRDARRTTHAIQQPVKNESAASDAFDEITYLKGQAFIRMLEAYVGEKEFRSGIRRYIKAHSYGSATTQDLWSALEKSSGKSVRAMAQGWTTQPGFPVVNVTSREGDGGGDLLVTQEHFTVNDPAPTPHTWQIPVSIGRAGQPEAIQTILFTGNSGAIPVRVAGGGARKVNFGNTGFYRASYSTQLAQALASQFSALSEDDRVNLLSDAWAMTEAGRADAGQYLDLVARLNPGERSLAIWDQVLGSLGQIEEFEHNSAGGPAFELWMKTRLRGPLTRLGWDPKAQEPSNEGLLRTRIITALGMIGDDEVVVEARRRFTNFLTNAPSLAPDLRTPVCQIVGRHADTATWEKLHALALTSGSTEEQNRYQQSFQNVNNATLAHRTLDLALTEERPLAQWFPIVPSVADRHPDLAWEFAQLHADALISKVPAGGAFFTRNTYFGSVAAPFNEPARADELEAFVARKVGPDAGPETAKIAEQIRFKAAFKARLLPVVDAWIASQKRDKPKG
ncbi:MAG: aminopeptidase [Verrucomicrobiales bacterium]|nr:aminopeptidase [Verrucomicrobiales bacterium]